MQMGFERLEPDEGKLSRPVLRGGIGSDAALLPDKVPDPDMTVRLWRNGMAEALSFQDSTTYREVYPEPGKANLSAKKELNSFLSLWLRNLVNQGHKVETLGSD